MDDRIGFGLYQSCGNRGSVGRDVCLCFGCRGVSGVGGEWVGGLDQGLDGLCYVCVSCESGLFFYRWQVQVSLYYSRRIAAHLRCTQCSTLLHLIDICFLPCICLWQISQIQTCLCVVVGPGFASTSPAYMRSSGSHPAGPHGRLSKKR